MRLKPARITVARCWEKDESSGEAFVQILYASHDVTEVEATAALTAREAAEARGDRDPVLAFDRLHAVIDAFAGRYALTGYDCRRVAADRLARILSWTRGVDPDKPMAQVAVERFADRVFERLAVLDEYAYCGDVFRPFLRSLDGDDLDEIFPDDLPDPHQTRAQILRTLGPRRRSAVDAAVAKVGSPDDGWSEDELRRSLRLHVERWREVHPSMVFACSDRACAESLRGLPGVRRSFRAPEGATGGEAMRLAVLFASEASIETGPGSEVFSRRAARAERHKLTEEGGVSRVSP